MIGQVQTVGGQKQIVPLSDTTPVDVVQSGNVNSVTSNAVASALGVYQKLIKYKEVQINNLTMSANGYVSIASYKPSGMNNFLFALMYNYGNTSSKDALGINADGSCAFGTANSTVTSIVIRYFYTD